jgi:hypothetical protein
MREEAVCKHKIIYIEIEMLLQRERISSRQECMRFTTLGRKI